MPRFFNANDLNFIKTISEEVVDYVVEQAVTLFKVSVYSSKTNLYGESVNKVYNRPTNLMAIVNREERGISYETTIGPDSTQTIEFHFNTMRLRTNTNPIARGENGVEVPVDSIQNELYGYPEIGDVILFDNTYYEVDNVKNSRLIGGSPTIWNKTTNQFEDTRQYITVNCHMVRRSKLQIEDREI